MSGNLRHAIALAVLWAAILPLSNGGSKGGAHHLPPSASLPDDDPLYILLKTQTEAFSDASSRLDQTAMDKLLDDDVLFSSGSGSVDRDLARDKNDDLSAFIKLQTQAFRDAGRRGDVAAMKSYLDDNVVFVNEDGVVTGRSDFLRGAPAAPPKGTSSTVAVTDWVLHSSGGVAVSSFVDDQVIHCGAQALNYKFLSVETWVKHGEAWKLLASHTIPLHQDPPGVTLSPDQLNEYAGAYRIAPDYVVRIVRDGNALKRINKASTDKLIPEARDVFFVPGLPSGYARRRIIFQRDAGGRVSGYATTGLVFTKTVQSGDTASGTPARGPLVLRDFVVRRSGDVAVATFFHDRDTNYSGQVLHETYRSSESWILRGAEWKMISSQGSLLQSDPIAVTTCRPAVPSPARSR